MTAVQRSTGPDCPGVTETAVRDLAKTLSGSSEIRIWELAEIEGLRHAPSYPIRDRKPNKTTPKSTR